MDHLNFSYIMLIPKREAPESVGDYRPIALLNGPLTIMTKILANCLALKLQLVQEEQTGFIAARNIFDEIAIVHEVIHQSKKDEVE